MKIIKNQKINKKDREYLYRLEQLRFGPTNSQEACELWTGARMWVEYCLGVLDSEDEKAMDRYHGSLDWREFFPRYLGVDADYVRSLFVELFKEEALETSKDRVLMAITGFINHLPREVLQ